MVLVAGGGNGADIALASAQLYNSATGVWSPTGSLVGLRGSHTATQLPSGRVLVAGGVIVSGDRASAELYDPATGTWSPTGDLDQARPSLTPNRLGDGKVLVTGGGTSADLFDPASGAWSAAANLRTARLSHTAALLAGGKALVMGGRDGADDLSGPFGHRLPALVPRPGRPASPAAVPRLRHGPNGGRDELRVVQRVSVKPLRGRRGGSVRWTLTPPAPGLRRGPAGPMRPPLPTAPARAAAGRIGSGRAAC